MARWGGILFGIYIIFPMPFFSALYADIATQRDLHQCLQLPITGSVKDTTAFEIFQKVEQYLKQSDWCYYKSSASAFSILHSYQPDIGQYLQKEQVLKKIANQVKVGSMIRMEVNVDAGRGEMIMAVVGDNGHDIFFSERAELEEISVDLIAQKATKWLDIYARTIPYDGRIVAVIKDRFIVDMGKTLRPSLGGDLQVLRPVAKSKHPLLKEVVAWETKDIGWAKVVGMSAFQLHAEMTVPGTGPVKLGDWAIVSKKLREGLARRPTAEGAGSSQQLEQKLDPFGQLGSLTLGLKLGMGSDTTGVTTERIDVFTRETTLRDESHRVSGLDWGFHFHGELWASKNYLAAIALERSVGQYMRQEGEMGQRAVGLVQSFFRFELGYRYLPLGLFWGPQLSLYLGYGVYRYDLDISSEDGFGHHDIRGFLFGLKGSLPLYRSVRGFVKLHFLPFPQYFEQTRVFGHDTLAATSYQMELGINYLYSPKISFDGSFEITSNKVRFVGNNGFNFHQTAFKGGVAFAY